jgi:hypothetical protein
MKLLFRIAFWDVNGSTSQKTILNIILAAVRTSNLTYEKLFTVQLPPF